MPFEHGSDLQVRDLTAERDVTVAADLTVADDGTIEDLYARTLSAKTGGALTINAYTLGGSISAASYNITGATTLSATNLTGTLTTASQTNITGVGTTTAGTWTATPIGVAYGGLGLSTIAINRIPFASAAD